MKVLGIGDNVCDKYLETSTIYPGGNAMNFAVFARKMGYDSAYLGSFGDDVVGKHVSSVAKELGLDLSHCRFVSGENGLARVWLVDGDRVFLPGNKGGACKEHPPILDDSDMEYLNRFDLIHTSIYSYLEPQLYKLKQSSAFVSMDFSDDYTPDYLAACCPYIDAAILSCGKMPEDEILSLQKQVASYGPSVVIATRGSKGAQVLIKKPDQADDSFDLYQQPPHLVEATDTMGAGDAFLTCFLVQYVEGTRISEALSLAADFAASQCLVSGSFGHGKVVPLTIEDRAVMDRFLAEKQ
jgi:sugar/nucleoside kinase (ribokinase family)